MTGGFRFRIESSAIVVMVVGVDVAVVVEVVVSVSVVVAAVVIALGTVDNLHDVSNQSKRPSKTTLLKFFISKVLLIKSIKTSRTHSEIGERTLN